MKIPVFFRQTTVFGLGKRISEADVSHGRMADRADSSLASFAQAAGSLGEFLQPHSLLILQVVQLFERDADHVADCLLFVWEQLSRKRFRRLRRFRLSMVLVGTKRLYDLFTNGGRKSQELEQLWSRVGIHDLLPGLTPVEVRQIAKASLGKRSSNGGDSAELDRFWGSGHSG